MDKHTTYKLGDDWDGKHDSQFYPRGSDVRQCQDYRTMHYYDLLYTPNHPSSMQEIIERVCTSTVLVLKKKTRLEKGHVFNHEHTGATSWHVDVFQKQVPWATSEAVFYRLPLDNLTMKP